MRNPLITLETHLAGFVERLFHGKIDAHTLMIAITRAFEDALASDQPIPTHLSLHLHPLDYAALRDQQQALIHQLQQYIHVMSQQRGISLAGDLVITLIEAPDQERYRVGVTLSTEEPSPHGTAQMPVADVTPEPLPADACLMRDGRTLYKMDRYVINLGRHFDNHVALEDARVSRWHAQIRLRHGHFTIYDLNSTHGTFVNGARIVEHILQTGDVIQLGGVKLVYLQEDSTEQQRLHAGDTQIKRPKELSDTEMP